MNKFVVTIFPDEKTAYEGFRALQELSEEGSISLFSNAVVLKDAEGAIEVKNVQTEGPLGTAIGAVLGGLVGLLAGPIGAVAGLAGGVMAGGLYDLYNVGVSNTFVKSITDELSPGKAAVIAEVAETWMTPLDTRMEALGGIVVRSFRHDVEDQQITREIDVQSAEYHRLKSAVSHKAIETEGNLQVRLDATKKTLKNLAHKAEEKIGTLKEELEVRAEIMEKQAKKTSGDVQKRVGEQLAELKDDYESRRDKLEATAKKARDALKRDD
ncbi:Uncharacterized membrane protein [Thalassovita taeanensis]|uniref:Uncharacterized membrane protein n=2 Tax=Thalassovita taeanensis TaxID=657014 RepID=A0A1H9DQP2_9RHOB|nr:Uncharacterized membrane protein [Thalassovita taeanensis]